MTIVLRTLRNIGWRPVASYFFLFVIFLTLALLYNYGLLNLWGVGALAFLFSAMPALILYNRLISPLKEVATIAQDMASGNLDQEIPVFAQDEIGDLARSINYMARRLKNSMDDFVLEKGRIQAILNSMSDGVIAVDSWGRVALINTVVENIFRITMEASRGKSILRVMRNCELEKLLHQSLETGKSIKKQIQIMIPEPRIYNVHVIPLQKAGEDRGGVVALLRNITEKKMLEEMRSEFVANVSHELRTPLTSIRGFAETLLDGANEEPEVARQFLEIIYHETKRLSRLIDELLNLSRIEDPKFVLNRQHVDMANLIKRTAAMFKHRAKEKNIAIKIEIADNLPVVQGDPDMLRQVLINLMDNAFNYTQPGGQIRASAVFEHGELKVDVQDNGMGISPENLSRLFERFYRVDKARSRELGGTGLGLAIVKHIVDVHHGKVQVESKIGRGSTFSFSLPLNEPEAG